MEENRLSSGITVEAVRHSVEQLLAYLNHEIRHTEELIREHINSHPGLKQQSALLDSFVVDRFSIVAQLPGDATGLP